MSGAGAGEGAEAEPVTVLTMTGFQSDDPAWADAVTAYTSACEYVDAKRLQYEAAERIASRREDEMRAVYERLTAGGTDGG
jgi:hypothetical protein